MPPRGPLELSRRCERLWSETPDGRRLNVRWIVGIVIVDVINEVIAEVVVFELVLFDVQVRIVVVHVIGHGAHLEAILRARPGDVEQLRQRAIAIRDAQQRPEMLAVSVVGGVRACARQQQGPAPCGEIDRVGGGASRHGQYAMLERAHDLDGTGGDVPLATRLNLSREPADEVGGEHDLMYASTGRSGARMRH